MPRFVVWYDENGEVFYYSDGGDIDLYIIDERCPRDRVYLHESHKAEPGTIDRMIGNSRIGRSGDMPGAEAAVRAVMNGEPPPKTKLGLVVSNCDCDPWPGKCPYCGKEGFDVSDVKPELGDVYRGPQEPNAIKVGSEREARKRFMQAMSVDGDGGDNPPSSPLSSNKRGAD